MAVIATLRERAERRATRNGIIEWCLFHSGTTVATRALFDTCRRCGKFMCPQCHRETGCDDA